MPAMAIFDECVERIEGYVEEMRAAGRRVWEFSPALPASDTPAPLPFKVGPGAGSGLVMKSDTFLELGSPAAGSCAFALCSETSLIRDGRVRLIGPDVQESPSGAIPFGQVIMAGGAALTDEEYQHLVQSQYTGDQIEGYMVKSIPGRIWGRVSNGAAQRGFDFRFLGAALMRIVKTRVPQATAAEVLFVTSGTADVGRLADIGDRVSVIGREMRRRVWEKRGIDISACAFGGDCGSCGDRAVCAEVRKIASARRS
jgi:CO dehydrogenase/acetyl-CoA synthase beta subunit